MKIYYVNDEYIQYLRKFDRKVSYKKDRPYVGVIMKHNNHLYFTPLTSPKDYMYNKKYARIHYPIDKGKKGFIKLGNSIPISMKNVTKIDIDNILDEDYKTLLKRQVKFIDNNEENIKDKFKSIFNKTFDKNHFLKSICCDFKILEVAEPLYNKYKNIESILTNQFDVEQKNIKLNIDENEQLIVTLNNNSILLNDTENEKILARHLVRPFKNQIEYEEFKLRENCQEIDCIEKDELEI